MGVIHWHTAIELAYEEWDDYCEYKNLEDKPGLYFFSRKFGKKGEYQPFYIGRSINIRKRLKQYFVSSGKHERHIRDFIQGKKDPFTGIYLRAGACYFHFGYVNPSPGLNKEKSIAIAERLLIQYGRIVNWKLINNHLAGPSAFRTLEMQGKKYSHLLPEKLIGHK